MDTAFGAYIQPGTLHKTGATNLTGRQSLISTWGTRESGRQFYDSRQSHELDVKLRANNLGPQLRPLLKAGDLGGENAGLCSKQHLLQTALLHFNVLITPGEQQCLISEWQVMDHLTGNVDYESLCTLASAPPVAEE